MSTDFTSVLRGLMANRQLTRRVLSRASGRAESTIGQLMDGRIPPEVGLLQDIAPALRMPPADLFVIAGLPTEDVAVGEGPYAATQEIGSLVAAASRLSPQQVELLISHARRLHEAPETGSRTQVDLVKCRFAYGGSAADAAAQAAETVRLDDMKRLAGLVDEHGKNLTTTAQAYMGVDQAAANRVNTSGKGVR